MNELFDSITEIDDNNNRYFRLDNLNRDELVRTLIEVTCNSTDDFLKIKETLTRIGIANRDKKTLYQSCHILHKKGKFYITHFKEMFAMDSRYTEMTLDDYARRNHIAKLLEDWGLLKILNKDVMYIPVDDSPVNVYVLPYREKTKWNMQSKYNIGGFAKKGNNE